MILDCRLEMTLSKTVFHVLPQLRDLFSGNFLMSFNARTLSCMVTETLLCRYKFINIYNLGLLGQSQLVYLPG